MELEWVLLTLLSSFLPLSPTRQHPYLLLQLKNGHREIMWETNVLWNVGESEKVGFCPYDFHMPQRAGRNFLSLGMAGRDFEFCAFGKDCTAERINSVWCSSIDVPESTQKRENYRDMSTLSVCYFSQRKESTFHSQKIPVLLKRL